VFGHDDVSHDHEVVTLPGLFQDGEKATAPPGSAQKR
jgi:hypothetical protein